MGNGDSLTKYAYTSNLDAGYYGFTDNKTVLEPEDDAAHVNLGGKWRMPTPAEWEELYDCKRSWDMVANGIWFTSNINGKSIFLPAAGEFYLTYLDGSTCHYWSSSLATSRAPVYALYAYYSGSYHMMYSAYRSMGLTIRPVSE